PALSFVAVTVLASKPWKSREKPAPPPTAGAPGGDCQAAALLQLALVGLFQIYCAWAAELVRSNPTAIRQTGKARLTRIRFTVASPGGGTAGSYRHWEHRTRCT